MNISKTVRDRAISSEFLTRRVVQEYPKQRGKISVLFALIHPIQWTIAYPVGADRPAKRQKKTSCVSTGQAGPVLCTLHMACRTSFLSRQHDVIASFSFGAHAVYTEFLSGILV